jgi:hypothetical protein
MPIHYPTVSKRKNGAKNLLIGLRISALLLLRDKRPALASLSVILSRR